MPNSGVPRPRSTVRYPAEFDYENYFLGVQPYAKGEGGGVYTVDEKGRFYVITDERTMGDFMDLLDEEFEPITVREFESAADRDAYCAAHYRHLRRGEVGAPGADGFRLMRANLSFHEPHAFRDLEAAYGDNDLASPTRSTMPLLACWRDPVAALERLSDALGQPLAGFTDIHFEYRVLAHPTEDWRDLLA